MDSPAQPATRTCKIVAGKTWQNPTVPGMPAIFPVANVGFHWQSVWARSCPARTWPGTGPCRRHRDDRAYRRADRTGLCPQRAGKAGQRTPANPAQAADRPGGGAGGAGRAAASGGGPGAHTDRCCAGVGRGASGMAADALARASAVGGTAGRSGPCREWRLAARGGGAGGVHPRVRIDRDGRLLAEPAIRRFARARAVDPGGAPNLERPSDRLAGLTVLEDVRRVCGTPMVQGPWQRAADSRVLGTVSGLEERRLRDLDCSIGPGHFQSNTRGQEAAR